MAARFGQLDTGIYRIANTVNGRSYIGSAVRIRKRWKDHRRQLSKGSHHSKFFQRCWNKTGEDFFVFEVILFCKKEDLIYFEQRAIDVIAPEYNAAPKAGSQLGFKMSPEARAKLSSAAKRTRNFTGKRHSEESKRKISEAKRGIKRGPLSMETRAKISAAHKGMRLPEEVRQKISKGLTGLKQSKETIERRMRTIRNNRDVGVA